MKFSRSSQICRYFIMGTCAFGNRCQRSHNDDLKANASYSHNEGNSDPYESPVDNGIDRSDKRSSSEGEDEEAQENVQDGLPNGHMLDPIPSEVVEEYAEPDVQDSGLSQEDILTSP
jgi:Zinc finger C-x8-C-x5-C-x3-H type (and similar)